MNSKCQTTIFMNQDYLRENQLFTREDSDRTRGMALTSGRGSLEWISRGSSSQIEW